MSSDQDPYRGLFSKEDSEADKTPEPPSEATPAAEPAPRPVPSPRTVDELPPRSPEEMTAIIPPLPRAAHEPPAPPTRRSAPAEDYDPRRSPFGLPEQRGAHAAESSAALVPARREVAGYEPVALDKTDYRRMKVPAEQGWRAGFHAITRINLGPGKDEQYEISLKDRVVRPVRTTFPVAVLNLKGGVGKTVVTKALGSTMSQIRGDKVIAVDLDNESGNLTERHGRETQLSLIDLVSDSSVGRYHDVRAHTSADTYSKLEVLSQPEYARSGRIVSRNDFGKTMTILHDFYSVVLLDCGVALKSELMGAVLNEARALVVVTSASIDALQETDQTLEWLRYNGYQKLLENLILIVNHTDPGKPNVVVEKVVEQFSRKPIPLERIFILPFDRHVREGREISLKLLSKKSRRRYLEISAALSDMFPKTAD